MEITGFDEQMGAVKSIAKAFKKANTFVNKKTAFVPAPKITMRKAIVKKGITPMQSVAPKKTIAVKRSTFKKLMASKSSNGVVKPTQKSPIVTAKQYSTFKNKPVKRTSAPIKVFSTDGTLKQVAPSSFYKMSDVKRSFANVDLPYHPVTPKNKIIRVKNTPLDLPININMIEPAVDAGTNNYYGK